jgi:hypothetical protein
MIKIDIYENWHVTAEASGYGVREVRLCKVKGEIAQHEVSIPEDALIRIGKWLELRKQLRELEK